MVNPLGTQFPLNPSPVLGTVIHALFLSSWHVYNDSISLKACHGNIGRLRFLKIRKGCPSNFVCGCSVIRSPMYAFKLYIGSIIRYCNYGSNPNHVCRSGLPLTKMCHVSSNNIVASSLTNCNHFMILANTPERDKRSSSLLYWNGKSQCDCLIAWDRRRQILALPAMTRHSFWQPLRSQF